MKKKNIIILSIIGFILIVIGGSMLFIRSLKNDRAATLLRMNDVATEYKSFENQIDTFNDMRNSLYLNVFENVYYDTMAAKDPAVKSNFSEYEIIVNGIAASATNLSNLCGTIYYPDSSINRNCKSFSSVYEQVVNAFVSDVKLYNNNISQYNKYQKENDSTSSLENYKTDKKYIDYNNDGKYEGKEM